MSYQKLSNNKTNTLNIMVTLTKTVNATAELLNDFVLEINEDWAPNYRAKLISDDEMIIVFESYNEDNEQIFEEISGVKNNNLWAEDEDVFDSLVYMFER